MVKKQSVKHGLRYRFTLKSFEEDWYTRECSLIFLFGKGFAALSNVFQSER